VTALDHIIYSDGTNKVTVTDFDVTVAKFSEDNEVALSTIVMSHEAFREVVLGWERYHAQKED